MLLLQLRIDGDSRGAQRAADDTRRSLTQLGQESRKPAGNPLQPIEDGAGRAGNSVGSLRMIFRAMGREAALLGGPMAGVIGQVGTLAVGTGRLGVVMTASTLTIAAIAATAYKAVTAFSTLEQHQVSVAAALVATKTASGQTVAGLEAMTRELARSGTQTVEDIRASEVALLRFKAVGGDTFGTVLRLARDAASGGFAPMKDATIAIGKALADPTKATEALRDIGLSLSVEQQRLATDFYNSGQRAKAFQVILAAITQQIGGTDAKAADTLGAAWGRAAKSSGMFFEQMGGGIADLLRLRPILDGVAGTLDKVAAGRWRALNPFSVLREQDAAAPKGDRQPGPTFSARFDIATADIAGASGPMKELVERVKGVTSALEVEARTAGLSATALRIYNEQTTAGVLNNATFAAQAKEIAAAVQTIANKNFARDLTADSIKQESALRTETATVTMSTGAAAAYRYEQEKLSDAKARGVTLSDANREALQREAQTIGGLTQQLEGLRTVKALGTDVIGGGLKDIRNEIANGATAFGALKTAGLNALTKISDKLIDMSANNLWNAAFGGKGSSGGLLGILGSLFGSGASQPVGVVGGAGSMPVPTFAAAGGGTFPGGRWGVVGERGWELMQTHPGGGVSIYSHERSKGMMSSLPGVPGFAGGGFMPAPVTAPPLAPMFGGAAAPVVHIHPAAPGETFDAHVNSDGSLALVGRMVDDKIGVFSRSHLPTRVHDIIRDPRAR